MSHSETFFVIPRRIPASCRLSKNAVFGQILAQFLAPSSHWNTQDCWVLGSDTEVQSGKAMGFLDD